MSHKDFRESGYQSGNGAGGQSNGAWGQGQAPVPPQAPAGWGAAYGPPGAAAGAYGNVTGGNVGPGYGAQGGYAGPAYGAGGYGNGAQPTQGAPTAAWGAGPGAAPPAWGAGPAPRRTLGWSVDRRTLNLVGGGALGALGFLLLMRYSRNVKPAVTSVMKEAYGAKEWLLGKTEGFVADMQDAAAEAKHATERERDLESLLEALADDEAMQRKLQEILARKRAAQRSP